MKCPVCSNVNLVMSERQGIEIDYCPECRGIWLDRGELDKIIDRSIPQSTQVKTDEHRHHTHKQHNHGMSSDDYYKRKKKESFLSELFDF